MVENVTRNHLAASPGPTSLSEQLACRRWLPSLLLPDVDVALDHGHARFGQRLLAHIPALLGVLGPSLAPVLDRQRGERDDVRSGGVKELRRSREDPRQLRGPSDISR